MTDTSTPTSVRKARHDARRDAAETIQTVLEPVNEVAQRFFSALTGQPGLTVQEQEQRLRDAAEAITDLPAALAKVANSPEVTEQVTAVAKTLTDAAEYAADRDFDAHQTAKAEAGEGALPALDGPGFVTPDEQIGDMLASALASDMEDDGQ